MLAGDGKTNVNFLWTSLDGAVEAQSLPSPVVGVCRNVVDQIVLGGAPHTAAFRVDYGGCVYHCRVRDDVLGGYKIIIVSECGCVDRRSFLLTFNGAPDPDEYYAARPTGLVEEIDPIDGLPRPDPDLATFTKKYKIPNELRVPPVGVDPARAPGGYRRTSSMYSGQMRKIVGCYHLLGKEAPFGYTYYKTHGIVEFPEPRATQAPGKKFWLVEISPSGVYAMPFGYRQRCCDLPAQFAKAMPTDAEVAETPALAVYQTEIDLAWAFSNKPNAKVTKLLEGTEMLTVYAKGDPHADSHGWAFAYSGKEASNVVFLPHNSPDNYWEIWHPRIQFTTANPSEGVFTISAAVDYLTSNAQMHNNVLTLFWFQSETYPNQYEEMFPYSYNGAGTVGNDYADIPIYVFYRGDNRHTLTMSYTEFPAGNDSGWSDVTMFNCLNFNGPIWHCEGETTRTTIGAGGTTFSMSFGGNTVSGSSGSNTERTITVHDKTFVEFCQTQEIFATCCNAGNNWTEVWHELWDYTQTDIALSGSHSGVVMAVASLGDRESVFLGQHRVISSGVRSESVFTMRNRLKIHHLCWTFKRGFAPPNCASTLPTPDTGIMCVANDFTSQCCLPGPTVVSSSGGTTFPSGTTETGSGHIGSNDITLAANADIDQFFVPINPAMATPAVNPGPIGWHGNLFYNEPNLVNEGFTLAPLADYVYHDGTTDWIASGGFDLNKPPSGPILPPLAFVGRV